MNWSAVVEILLKCEFWYLSCLSWKLDPRLSRACFELFGWTDGYGLFNLNFFAPREFWYLSFLEVTFSFCFCFSGLFSIYPKVNDIQGPFSTSCLSLPLQITITVIIELTPPKQSPRRPIRHTLAVLSSPRLSPPNPNSRKFNESAPLYSTH